MKQKHYYLFDNNTREKFDDVKLNQNNWDVLRNESSNKDFSIEKTIEEYEDNCRLQEKYRKVAELIVAELSDRGLIGNGIVSLGVGKWILEWHIKQICPDLYVSCTDYTPEAMEKLKSVFKSVDDVSVFDMLNGDYSLFKKDTTVIMYRVSTEFTRKQWDIIFSNMYDAGIKHIIYVPTEVASFRYMLSERISHFKNIIKRRRDIFCGWLYSESEFLKMFAGKGRHKGYYIDKSVPFDNTRIYYLSRK